MYHCIRNNVVYVFFTIFFRNARGILPATRRFCVLSRRAIIPGRNPVLSSHAEDDDHSSTIHTRTSAFPKVYDDVVHVKTDRNSSRTRDNDTTTHARRIREEKNTCSKILPSFVLHSCERPYRIKPQTKIKFSSLHTRPRLSNEFPYPPRIVPDRIYRSRKYSLDA